MRYTAWALAILVLAVLGMATLSRAAAPPDLGGLQRLSKTSEVCNSQAPGVSAGLQRAGLVVDYGAGRVFTACVTFTETYVTGLDLLERAGLSPIIDGGAVCQIGAVGCPAGAPCFCACMSPPSCVYWRYWTWETGAITWTFSAVGAAGRHLQDNDVDGWSWSAGAPPPTLAFADVCDPLPVVFLPLVMREP